MVLGLLSVTPHLFACEACQKILDFAGTARKSDLIAIAERVNDSEQSNNLKSTGKPDWIEIKVSRVLKGSLAKEAIRVNSWDGMCQYGLDLKEGKSYVVFLVKRTDAPCDHCEYDAVEYGCSVRAYPVENDRVYKDKAEILLIDFIRNLP